MRCGFLRDYRGARVQGEEALDRSNQGGYRWGIAYGTIDLGKIIVVEAEVDAGIGKLAAALNTAEDVWDHDLANWLFAGTYLEARRFADGTAVVDQAIAEVAAGGSRQLNRISIE
jgi:hypothetical protein